MRNKKTKTIYKLMVGFCTLGIISLPLMSLTSCATTWSIPNPVASGSVSPGQLNDPYLNLRSKDTYYDRNGVDISTYLPSNYMFDPSSGYFYANCSPVTDWETVNRVEQDPKFPLDPDKKIVIETDIIDPNIQTKYDPLSWYKMPTVQNDSTLKYTKTMDNPLDTEAKDNKITIHSYQNWSTIYSMNVVNVIAQSIAHLITQPLIYAGSLIANNEFDLAWTGKRSDIVFNHGLKGGTDEQQIQNNNFYEFLYALSNSTAIGKNSNLFKNVSSNFNFVTSPFVTFQKMEAATFTKPILTADWEYLFNLSQYATIKDVVDKKDANKVINKIYTYENVPLMIEPTNLLFTYVNTETHPSYFPNDYYQTDIDNIQINNAWSTMSKYTDVTNPKPTNLKYQINLNQPNHQNIEIKKDAEIKYDQRLTLTNKQNTIIDDNAINISANRFIMPMSFQKTEFYTEGVLDETKTKYENLSTNNLLIYPAYFATLPDVFKQVPESKNYKNETVANFGGGYILDGKKMAEYEDQLLKTISSGTEYKTPSNIKPNNEWILKYIPYLFSSPNPNATAEQPWIVDTNKIFLPLK